MPTRIFVALRMTQDNPVEARSRLIVAIVFLAAIILFGGSSRIEVATQPVVRLVAIAGGVWALWVAAKSDFRPARPLLIGASVVVALMAATLVPLPPAIWGALPGRGQLLGEMQRAGVGDAWRPAALLRTEAWNSLLSLTVPIATLLVLSVVPERHHRLLLAAIIALAFFSGLLGLVQLLGVNSAYPYKLTDISLPVGLFANRNHQAVLLALVVPMLTGLACAWVPGSPQGRRVLVAAGLSAIVILPLVLATGSRAGLIFGFIGLLASAWLIVAASGGGKQMWRAEFKNRRLLASAGAGALALCALVAVIVVRRYGASFDRLFGAEIGQELRYALFEPLAHLGSSYFPIGAGPGSFVEVFKIVEAPPILASSYLNHAHNEVLELFIEGGLPALLMLGLFLFWWTRAALRAWTRDSRRLTRTLARVGFIVTLVLMMASLADYPLRTPTLACVFACGLYWMSRASQGSRSFQRR